MMMYLFCMTGSYVLGMEKYHNNKTFGYPLYGAYSASKLCDKVFLPKKWQSIQSIW